MPLFNKFIFTSLKTPPPSSQVVDKRELMHVIASVIYGCATEMCLLGQEIGAISTHFVSNNVIDEFPVTVLSYSVFKSSRISFQLCVCMYVCV